MNVRWSLAASACLVFVALGPAAPARAADEPEVLFEDDFQTLEPSLGESNDYQWVKDKVFFKKLAAERSWAGLYQSFVFENADIAIKARFPQAAAKSGAAVGIAFWARDATDYYTLEVTDGGAYRVSHNVRGRWLFPVPIRKCPPLKTDPREWNDLRVVTLGRQAEFYVNGEKLITIAGQPPEGGGSLGPYFETGTEEGVAEFMALKVVQPTGEPLAAPSQDPQVLFADDFSAADPAWGEQVANKGVRNQTFYFQLNADEHWKQLNEAQLFEDFDATVKARLRDGDADASADLVFWAKDYNDHYVFTVYTDGQFAVHRWVKDRWLTPLSARRSDQAKFDLSDWTDLRVVAQGRKVKLMIGGVEVATLTGQPPPGGSQIGLRGQAGKQPCTVEFSSLVVRKPQADGE
jgi:hypothetical protein